MYIVNTFRELYLANFSFILVLPLNLFDGSVNLLAFRLFYIFNYVAWQWRPSFSRRNQSIRIERAFTFFHHIFFFLVERFRIFERFLISARRLNRRRVLRFTLIRHPVAGHFSWAREREKERKNDGKNELARPTIEWKKETSWKGSLQSYNRITSEGHEDRDLLPRCRVSAPT